MTETLAVLREGHPISTNRKGLDSFQILLHHCAVEESSLSIGRVKCNSILPPFNNLSTYHLPISSSLSNTQYLYIPLLVLLSVWRHDGKAGLLKGVHTPQRHRLTTTNRTPSGPSTRHLVMILYRHGTTTEQVYYTGKN